MDSWSLNEHASVFDEVGDGHHGVSIKVGVKKKGKSSIPRAVVWAIDSSVLMLQTAKID